MTKLGLFLAILLPGVCLGEVASPAWPPRGNLAVLEKIVVQDGGRKRPFLVFAEESLRAISGKPQLELEGRRVGSMEFAVRLWLDPEGWKSLSIVLVGNKPLKEKCGLDMHRKLFSHEELVGNPALRELLLEAAALRARPGNKRLEGLPKQAADIGLRLATLESLASGQAYRMVPHPQKLNGAWSPVPSEELAPLRSAWQQGDWPSFDRAALALKDRLASLSPEFQPPPWRISLETLYQKSHPIRWAWLAYLASGIVLWAAGKTPTGYRTGWALALVGFGMQIAGLAARVIISGRPPVTNMYESIIWVAFGTVLFALLFETLTRKGVFLLAAAPVAVLSLILADSQPASLSRSINPLVPVLRDNFWLTTHVLTITLSYAAFALALALGHAVLWQAIRGKSAESALTLPIYRCLQAGVLLLATGTILGGVWANYSWGRFWDWDPKEVWALVTLLAYLFLLHGRIAGKWAGFGLAVGSVVCFLSVLMAWYGVNFVLGAGLHSYGFGSGGLGWVTVFVFAELVFAGCAIWRKKCKSTHTSAAPALVRS